MMKDAMHRVMLLLTLLGPVCSVRLCVRQVSMQWAVGVRPRGRVWHATRLVLRGNFWPGVEAPLQGSASPARRAQPDSTPLGAWVSLVLGRVRTVGQSPLPQQQGCACLAVRMPTAEDHVL